MIPLCERTVIAGKYRLTRELAAGGMGAVWIARHLGLDEDVAVKFMNPSLPEPAEARARFAREARAAARVRGPHVVSVLDHGVDGDVPYLVMELLHGEHLGERLRRVGRLSFRDTAAIAEQVARALSRAHKAGIVHRDLKPANVFLARLDEEEIVKVLDFGIAKQQGLGVEDMTHGDVLMGSPQYMSPEQARGARSIDHRADLWSLGAILFRAVTGAPAFDGASAVDVIVRICAGPLPLPSRVSTIFGPEVDAFFAQAFDRDPARRFSSAREMAEAFAELARSCEALDRQRAALGGASTAESTPVTARLGGADEHEVETAPAPPDEEIDAFVERAFGALVGDVDEAAAPSTSRSAEMATPPARTPEVTVPLLRRLGVMASEWSEGARSSERSGQRLVAAERAARPPPQAPLRGAVVTLIDQGFTALRRGERETARRVWRAALGLDPSNRVLEANLRRLEAMGE